MPRIEDRSSRGQLDVPSYDSVSSYHSSKRESVCNTDNVSPINGITNRHASCPRDRMIDSDNLLS